MEIVKLLLTLVVVDAAASFAQQKCCYPDEYEAREGEVVGTVQSGEGAIILESIQFAFDYPNRRVGQFTRIATGGQVHNYHIIVDYNKSVKYLIEPKIQTCQKIPIPAGNMKHCVPSDAVYTGSSYIGDHELTVDTFTAPINEQPIEGTALMSVSQGGCIPIGVTFIGTQAKVPMLTVAGFANFTKGINDPAKYFTLPKYCSQTSTEKPKMYTTILRIIFG